MNAQTQTDETEPTSEWEHGHALNEGDEINATNTDSGPFKVVNIGYDGSVVAVDSGGERFEWGEGEVTGALSAGNFERVSDGKSHELATF